MSDYFLKAEDEATLNVALEAAGVIDSEGFVVEGYALDKIGTIHKPTGDYIEDEDEDGNKFPETAAIEGYHANLRGSLTDEQITMLPVIVAPSNPVRVWA